MIEIDEVRAIEWIGNFWDPYGFGEFFGSDDCRGVREALYANMMDWA